MRTVQIRFEDGAVSGVVEGDGETGILLAHGAGTNQHHPMMAGVRADLAGSGYTVMSFDYPYAERGSKRPDPTHRLVACHRAAAARLRHLAGDRIVMAGRSMGGRMATYLAVDGEPCLGIVLYAYPLHPAGKPDSLRAGHLASVPVPMLFIQGTRDALCRMDLLERHISLLANSTVHLLDGADHSYRGGGWTPDRVRQTLVSQTVEWIARLRSGGEAGAAP